MSYAVGQVCLNGHEGGGDIRGNPDFASAHCPDCGAEMVSACSACNEPIRGFYRGGAMVIAGWRRTAHCYSCGAPYPWTQRAIEGARGLLRSLDTITDDERDALIDLAPEIFSETPQTAAAAVRFRAWISRSERWVGSAFHETFGALVAETASRIMFGSGAE